MAYEEKTQIQHVHQNRLVILTFLDRISYKYTSTLQIRDLTTMNLRSSSSEAKYERGGRSTPKGDDDEDSVDSNEGDEDNDDSNEGDEEYEEYEDEGDDASSAKNEQNENHSNDHDDSNNDLDQNNHDDGHDDQHCGGGGGRGFTIKG